MTVLAWFTALHERLVERGVLRADAPVEAFTALPFAALALAQHDELLGDGAGPLRNELMEALVLRWAQRLGLPFGR